MGEKNIGRGILVCKILHRLVCWNGIGWRGRGLFRIVQSGEFQVCFILYNIKSRYGVSGDQNRGGGCYKYIYKMSTQNIKYLCNALINLADFFCTGQQESADHIFS